MPTMEDIETLSERVEAKERAEREGKEWTACERCSHVENKSSTEDLAALEGGSEPLEEKDEKIYQIVQVKWVKKRSHYEKDVWAYKPYKTSRNKEAMRRLCDEMNGAEARIVPEARVTEDGRFALAFEVVELTLAIDGEI